MGFEPGLRGALGGFVASLGCLLIASTAHAEPSAAQRETARQLMAEARDLREHRDFQGALERFRAADAIMAVPTTGYELAKAQADVGQLVEARATVRRILAIPEAAGEPDPFKAARQHAREFDAELDGRIGALRFEIRGVTPDEVVSVSVDGEAVPAAARSLPFRLNPGRHRVAAGAHRAEITRDVLVAETQTVTVTLEIPAAPADATAATLPPAEDQSAPLPGDHRHMPKLAYVAGGVAVVGLAVGTVTGIFAISKRHSVQQGCVGYQCPPQAWSDLDSARSLATVSTIGFAVAGAGVGLALVSFLAAKPGANASLQPTVSVSKGNSSVGLSGRF